MGDVGSPTPLTYSLRLVVRLAHRPIDIDLQLSSLQFFRQRPLPAAPVVERNKQHAFVIRRDLSALFEKRAHPLSAKAPEKVTELQDNVLARPICSAISLTALAARVVEAAANRIA
jgi:hypothetical protein